MNCKEIILNTLNILEGFILAQFNILKYFPNSLKLILRIS